MSTTTRQIDPSRKPLPALPTENSNLEKSIKPSSQSTTTTITTNSSSSLSTSTPPILPTQGSSDLQLDSVSLGHARKILKQSLHNCSISIDPWESIILGIVLDIAETVPKAIDVLFQNEIIKHDLQIKQINDKINDDNNKKKDDDKKDDKSGDKKSNDNKKNTDDKNTDDKNNNNKNNKNNNNDDNSNDNNDNNEKINEQSITDSIQDKIKNDPKFEFVITLKREESGNPTDSHFVYNYFDGEHLFKHENSKESNPSEGGMKRWIGGTVILRGPKKHIYNVDKILELMVYVICGLKLEMCLFRDNSVSRVDKKSGQDAEDVQNTLRNSRRSSKSSWLGWLMKHNDIQSIKEHVIKSYGKSEKNEKREKNEKSNHHNNHNHHNNIEKNEKPEKYGIFSPKRLSLRKSSLGSKSQTSSTTTISTDEEDSVININTDRFASAIHQMERVILSSSPGVKFPPPHLLMRLSEEETEIRLHTNADGTVKSYIARDAFDLANEFSNGNGNSTGKYRTYGATTRSNQVSLDFRSGLIYLMTNNNSLNGVYKHQSLSCSYSRFWSPTSILPCDNHKIVTLKYYDKETGHTDKLLGEMINYLCDHAYEICQDSSCDHPGIDHITTYTHNTGRISIILEKSSESDLVKLLNSSSNNNNNNDNNDNNSNSNNNILMWTECKSCSKKSQLVHMSNATYCYSFGKYLELLFYNEDFFCKNICEHVESRDSIVRCFYSNNLIVKIEYEHVDLFEMRLPKLQVSQEETPIFNTLGCEEEIRKLFDIDDEDAKRLLDETRLEITFFYGAVKRHITALEEYFDSLSFSEKKESNSDKDNKGSKGNNGNKDDKDDVESGEEREDYLKMLVDMTKDFRKEEFDLYDALKESKATALNDVRKLLVEKIVSTKKRLLDWQKKYVLEKDLEKFSGTDWDEPEYASSSNCHVFPGSPIIIREDEPSSIIALTISSRDYLRELSLMRQNVKLSFTQSAPVTPTSEYEHQPLQASNSFSLLALKNPTTTNLPNYLESEGIGVDQYSSNLRHKYVKESQGSGISEKISYGIESLGFNLSLSGRDKKRDPEKGGEKPKNGRTFSSIFGQKNEDSEKPKNGDTENEKQQAIFNEKVQCDNPEKLSSSTFEGFPWSRKSQKGSKDRKDSPHLKYQCTHGKKKFSCTVYYATQFDSLRRRCGIENICIDSLARCSSWEAVGGKSSSTFFKTKDERLVIKQMVSSWKIGEKEALLRFAPKYFEYMDKPPSKPSVLAKIFGFYTIKIKDTKKNNVIMKMDVLVMEHLFFEKTITRRFDLKGIQERHTKDQAKVDATLWDGDWVEGRYKSLLLIHSHSKKIIREAILNDTKFLADSNIMDYSLLVGVDDEKKELVAGIVDFIGAYTLYKKIENKGKTIGRSSKEVTVLPPDQYKDRFRNSIDQYFLAVPDKWIKSPNTDDPLSPISEEQLSPLFPDSPLSPTSINHSPLPPTSIQLPSVL